MLVRLLLGRFHIFADLLPASYWSRFYNSMGKGEAETLLLACSHHLGLGCFLIRESESRPGTFTLSLLLREAPPFVTHIRVLQRNIDGGGEEFTIQDRTGRSLPWFRSTADLILHFQQNEVPGLKVQGVANGFLGKPCVRSSKTGKSAFLPSARRCGSSSEYRVGMPAGARFFSERYHRPPCWVNRGNHVRCTHLYVVRVVYVCRYDPEDGPAR